MVSEQGEQGDRYFVLLSGRAEVERNGRPVNVVPPGDGFGDVALLGDVPRTATVRASGDQPLSLAVLGCSVFLTVVTGYPASATAGQQSVAQVRVRNAERPGDA